MICSCANGTPPQDKVEITELSQNTETEAKIVVGAEKLDEYLPLIDGKSVGIVGNQSSMIRSTHLVDSLLKLRVDIEKVFCPEHGFRGDADAGEQIDSSTDQKTGLPLISLYGKNKKPSADQLKGIEVLLFDIQDVGVRFYTYISTLHYVMEACAENNITLIILDRPNPNGHYVDGPVLELDFKSFVGMHPVPIVHGMTIGEYGSMINGQGWLTNQAQCKLVVITCDNYTHDSPYSLPIPPSPNLRSDLSIQLYPSLCLLEGTEVSCGRGTDGPFERYGHPDFIESEFFFIPVSGYGAKSPKFEGEKCFGVNLRDSEFERATKFDFSYLVDADNRLNGKLWEGKKKIFNLLAGNDELWRQVKQETSEQDIRKSWEPELGDYKEMRKKYMLYD